MAKRFRSTARSSSTAASTDSQAERLPRRKSGKSTNPMELGRLTPIGSSSCLGPRLTGASESPCPLRRACKRNGDRLDGEREEDWRIREGWQRPSGLWGGRGVLPVGVAGNDPSSPCHSSQVQGNQPCSHPNSFAF